MKMQMLSRKKSAGAGLIKKLVQGWTFEEKRHVRIMRDTRERGSCVCVYGHRHSQKKIPENPDAPDTRPRLSKF